MKWVKSNDMGNTFPVAGVSRGVDSSESLEVYNGPGHILWKVLYHSSSFSSTSQHRDINWRNRPPSWQFGDARISLARSSASPSRGGMTKMMSRSVSNGSFQEPWKGLLCHSGRERGLALRVDRPWTNWNAGHSGKQSAHVGAGGGRGGGGGGGGPRRGGPRGEG